MDYRDFQAGASQEHFWFKAKTGLIDYLSSVPQSNTKKILSVGVGTGEDLPTLSKLGSVYAIDIDAQALAMVPDHVVVEKKLADACNLPYPDGFFDMVAAFDVMEHVADDQKMVDEIYRVLKPGGSYIFTVPAFNFLFSAHDRALHHYRRYNKKMVKKLFTNFTCTTLGYWLFFMFVPASIARLATKKSTGQMFSLPALINALCYKVLALENWMLRKGFKFPFGLTLYGVYKKNEAAQKG